MKKKPKSHLKNRLKTIRKTSFNLLFLTIITCFFYFLYTQFYISKQLETTSYDYYLRLKTDGQPNDLLIINIDEASLAELGIWPWNRDYHAALIDRISAANPKAIVLNILFNESSSSDQLLYQAIKKNNRIVLPMVPPISAFQSPNSDNPPFNEAAAKLGHNAIQPDQDGIIRRTNLWITSGNESYPSLALSALSLTDPQIAAQYPYSAPETKNPIFSPVQLSDPILFAYNGQPNTIAQVSYIDVLAGRIASNQLENKVIFIGTRASGLGANYNIPAFSNQYRQMTGVELQAQIFEALRTDNIIHEVPILWQAFANIFFLIITCFIILKNNPINGIIIGVVSCIIQIIIMLIIFLAASTWLPLVNGIVLLLLFTIIYISFSSHIRLAEINKTLEIKVTERTRELTQSNQTLEKEIIERKRIASILRDKEKQLRTLIDSLHVAVVMIDQKGMIFQANKTIKTLFNISHRQIINTPFNQYFADDNNKIIHNAAAFDVVPVFDEFTADQDIIYQTSFAKKADGTVFSVDLAFTLITENHENYLICSIRDITEQVESDMLTQEFIATVSHELRTPITSIRGSLSLINQGLAGNLSPKANSLIDIALRNSERLLTLVNDILDVQKIQLGQLDFKLSSFDIIHLVKQAIEVNNAYAKSYQVSYVFKKPDFDEAWVYADSDRLIQVMSNLLSNAAKFSPSGSVVDIYIEKIDHSIRVSVIDYGTGIPESFRSRIFQKFAQAGDAKHRSKGTGLGLSITKALVEKMNGTISFISEEGKGSNFFFLLPEIKNPDPS